MRSSKEKEMDSPSLLILSLQKAIESLQVLYKRTSSIEAEQVAEDIDEAVDLEGRPQINHLEKEQSKKRKWRRTGTIKLSQDYRDVF